MLANLFDSSDECIELVKGLHGSEYILHEVLADAELLVLWKQESLRELDRLYRFDRQSAKRYCLRPQPAVSASETYSQLLGLDVKLQCRVSRSTFRCKLSDPGASKQDVENSARKYWLKMLVSFLVDAQLPVCEIANNTSEPHVILERAFGNRRMRTLRNRARAWKKVTEWMIMFKGLPHPQHVSEMLDYLTFIRQEGASRGQIDSVAAALSVIEDSGQVPTDQRISLHRLWIQSIKSHLAELDQFAKPTKRAPPLSVAMVISLEVLVCDVEAPKYARALSWIILVCVWACMRLSDLEGLAPGRITLSNRGLRGVLTRTKTTGPGKQAFLTFGVGFDQDW
eukprot:Skav220354  [mRNA]  locus=scaffold609:12297:13624:+ [translate_table: standard]